MRRAVIATAGTIIGLVALLDYKSSGAIGHSHVSVNGGPLAAAPSTTAPNPAPTTPSKGSATTTPSKGTAATSPATTTPSPSGRYTGTDVVYRYGDIEVQITIAAGRITNISIPQESASDPRSQFINGQAVPILTSEALAAQSLSFDVVSGATFTSDAFAQSLQSALTQAGR